MPLNYIINDVTVDQIETIDTANDKQKGDGKKSQVLLDEAHYSETELIKALNKENITLIKQIVRNQPNLLKQLDSDGFNTMTRAASEGNVEVIKAINEINPELLKEQDGSGLNAMTAAARVLRIGVMNEFNRINPELLTEPDGNGWNTYSLLISYLTNISFLCSFFLDKQVFHNFSKYGVPKGVAIIFSRVLLNSLPAKLKSNIGFLLIFGFLLPITGYIEKANRRMVERKRYNDAVLKIQSSLNNPPKTVSVREVKKNVYLLLSHSTRSHDDSMLIQQYYEKAIAEYGTESFFEICSISQGKPTNAVLALPGVHYEKEYLEGWNKMTHCRNPLTNMPGPTYFVVDDVYNELYEQRGNNEEYV